jgi:hypothetical protein
MFLALHRTSELNGVTVGRDGASACAASRWQMAQTEARPTLPSALVHLATSAASARGLISLGGGICSSPGRAGGQERELERAAAQLMHAAC